MAPAPELVERFRGDLDKLIDPGATVGLAVSGGPDSVALLLLAAAARPGKVCVATVDHALRAESGDEARTVAELCEGLGVSHEILKLKWADKPRTGIQKKARDARYRALSEWARRSELGAIVTGHHLDDQAETFVMRIARGVGVKGLAGMRGASPSPGGSNVTLLRPLLGWRRSELEAICAATGVAPANDPSNEDRAFERVRVRRALADAAWFDPEAIARSAAVLGQADAALDWAADKVWAEAASVMDGRIVLRTEGIPAEIRRRLVRRAVRTLAREGRGADLRGRKLDGLLAALRAGRQATLRGVLCSGGEDWSFVPAPDRTRRSPNPR